MDAGQLGVVFGLAFESRREPLDEDGAGRHEVAVAAKLAHAVRAPAVHGRHPGRWLPCERKTI